MNVGFKILVTFGTALLWVFFFNAFLTSTALGMLEPFGIWAAFHYMLLLLFQVSLYLVYRVWRS